MPPCDLKLPAPDGSRQLLLKLGPEKFAAWILKQKPLLMTDTTFRDAHQSLLATRMRTFDMLQIAEAYARLVPKMFSIEMWGGATFDTAMRFLKECPWQRLADLRTRIPNILFQMLLRASNAVGYTNYPDNVVTAFVHESAQAGIDLFRIFDSLNWAANMRVAMDAVLKIGHVVRSGDLLHRRHSRSGPAEIRSEVLRRVGQEARKDGGAYPGHQRHGRPLQALRGPRARQSVEARDRHPDPFPHARHQRHLGRQRAEGGGSRARYCRWCRCARCRASRRSRI